MSGVYERAFREALEAGPVSDESVGMDVAAGLFGLIRARLPERYVVLEWRLRSAHGSEEASLSRWEDDGGAVRS